MRKRLAAGFLLAASLLASSASHAGLASLTRVWTGHEVLSACFFRGSPDVRRAIAAIAGEWTENAGIRFDFGPGSIPQTCQTFSPADVRIELDVPANYAWLGSSATTVPPAKPTLGLRLNGPPETPAFRRAVLSEFGRALGLLHPEQDPRAGCGSGLEPGKAPSGVAGPLDVETVSDTTRYLSTPFDADSVMRTRAPGAGVAADPKCGGPLADRLSAGDREFISLIYPKRPEDLKGGTAPKQIIVRLEGGLAVEHFGYVVEALYDGGFLEVVKTPSGDAANITEAMSDRGLAPAGMVPAHYADVLCRMNPHICRLAKDGPRWSNTRTVTNHIGYDAACGSPDLPSDIFCLPNLRLESYTTRVVLDYSAAKQDLSSLVVKKLVGCDSWNDDCQNLVRDLNDEHSKEFSKGKAIFGSAFSGPIEVPARGFRLVLSYKDDAERGRIIDSIEAVIRARAKDLGVEEGDVAISVTTSMGRASAENGFVVAQRDPSGHDPVQDGGGAGTENVEPLKIMHYPFDGDLSGQSTVKISDISANTDVAIWDLRIDAHHCEFGSSEIVFASKSTVETQYQSPGLAADCGEKRAMQDEPFFDHATAVAGIISAALDRHGIAGAAPGTRIWAWEVVEGVELIAGDDPLIKMSSDFRRERLKPRVINISQSYTLDDDQISDLESLLFKDEGAGRRGLHNKSLIVAAAGVRQTAAARVGRQIDRTSSSECKTYPACFGGPDRNRNFITVVALDKTGTGLLMNDGKAASNYGNAFDVSAVGEVDSTLYGGWIGAVAGSSFAAPYVTGLAGLLFSKTESLSMRSDIAEVRNRILFTADDFDGIRGTSRFGRINFAKALSFERDWLRLRQAMCGESCWKPVTVNRRLDATLTVERGVRNGDPVNREEFKFSEIRAINRQEDGLFSIVYEKSRKLDRIVDARIALSDEKIIDIGGVKSPLDLATIDEYIACSFKEECDPW